MLRCILWVLSVSEEFNRDLHASLGHSNHQGPVEVLIQYNFPFFPGNLAWTRWTKKLLNSLLLKGLIGRVFGLFLFRYPNLIIICSLLVLLPINSEVRCLVTTFLISGVWVKTFHLLIYRYKFGEVDNLLQSLSVPRMSSNLTVSSLGLRGVRNFVRIFPTTLSSAIIGYGAAYYNFSKGAFSGNSLQGIVWDQPLSVQTLYFSASTFCTVGYGDIFARGWLVQLTVVTEMILSLTLLVLFITAFSSTAVLWNRTE